MISYAHRSEVYNTIENQNNYDRVLMVVTVAIYGHPVRALIDSDGIRCFVSCSAVVPLRLPTVRDYIFLELEDGQKSSPRVKQWMSQ